MLSWGQLWGTGGPRGETGPDKAFWLAISRADIYTPLLMSIIPSEPTPPTHSGQVKGHLGGVGWMWTPQFWLQRAGFNLALGETWRLGELHPTFGGT